jgi:hypothetical protein
MSNIPGANNVTPGVYTNVETQSTGANVPGGILVPCIIGEGSTNQIIVASALGGGQDGLNPTFTSTNGAVGRYFQISQAPLVENRTQLFKNGVTLVGLEQDFIPTNGVFSDDYDYCIDYTTGDIELQSAYIINQGGSSYTSGATNIGDGYISNLSLVDINAPKETWTIKCVSVARNASNQPIVNSASFIAFGSVSGNVLDGYGDSVVWVSNGVVVSNGILSFSLFDTVPFNPGDYFTVEVYSGVLSKGDTLTATFIPVGNINNPTFFTDMSSLTSMTGPVSLTNVLSLGAQLAFENNTPGVMALQAAPSLPRRTSIELESNFNALSTNYNDFVLPLPIGVQPATGDAIHIFVTNPTTNVETQLLPNMFPFYTLGTVGQPTVDEFVFDNTEFPGGNSYSYSVIQSVETLNFGTDGYLNTINGSNAYFSSVGVGEFNSSYVGLNVKIIDSNHNANIGTFPITAVINGNLVITIPSSVTDTNIKFEVQDPTAQGFYLVLNHNIVPNGNSLRITLVDERDAGFFDAGWETALSVLETQEVDIIVPLPLETISVIFQNTVNHCIAMSNIRNRKERVAFIGAINGLTPANLTGAQPAAVENIGVLEGIQGNTVAEVLAGNTEDLTNYAVGGTAPNGAYSDTYRCVYFFPDQIMVQVGADNETLDGFYIAAAAAGYVAGVPNVAMPLTNKVLSGFSILSNRQFSPTVYQNLAAAGVTALQPVSGGGLVVWGLTTTDSGAPEEQEISIVFIRDTIAKEFRAGLAGFIGQPGYPNVITNMSARALSMLKSFISQGLITNFANLNIAQDSVDPRQYNITVLVQPVYPVNWIYVTVGVGVIGS